MIGSDEEGKTVLQKTQEHDQALYRMQQIQQQNTAVQQERQKAPSSLKSDSLEAKQVRQEETQDAQQAYFGGGFQQRGSTSDQFAALRAEALKTGKFDYGSARSSFYSPPETFVNTKGERVTRTAPTPTPFSFGTPVSGTPSSELAAPTQMARLISSSGGTVLVKPVPIPQRQLSIPQANSTNPELRQAILQTFVNDPSGLRFTGTDKGSYLYSLFQKGVLAKEDFTFINQLATNYNAKIQQENVQIRQQNIKSSLKTQQDITDNLMAAQKAGVTSVQITDSQGKVLGTVNPQNIGLARLQTLKLFSRQGGTNMQYTKQTSQGPQGVTSTQTVYKPSNVLTAFTGGALGGFAELGLIGIGLVSKLTGKEITIPGTTTTIKPSGIIAQAESKVQKTFGKETLDQLISGEKVDLTNPIALASLAGFGGSLIATGGAGGIKAVISAPSKIVEALRAPSIAKTIFTKEFQEGSALSQLQKVKGTSSTFEMEQATIQKGQMTKTSLEDLIKVERLPSGKVQAVRIPGKEITTPIKETEQHIEIPYGVTEATAKGTTSLVTKVTNLTPQQVVIKGLPLEVGKAMGLKQIAQTGGFPVFAGKLTSKNIPILLEEIRIGNIKPTFDILQFATSDISKGGGRYGMMARSPEMLSSNAFERVVRPNVMRYFESKIELEKEAPKAIKSKKEMKPIGTVSEGKGGAGAAGKAQALTHEEKSIVQSLTKEKLGSQTTNLKATMTQQATRQGLSTGLTRMSRQRDEEETLFLQTPKGTAKTITLGKTKTITKQDLESQLSNISFKPKKTITKERQGTGLTSKTTPTNITIPVTITKTTTKQVTTPLTGQHQALKTEVPNLGTPQVPDTTKKLGGLVPGLPGARSGALGKVSKSGARKSYIGNVPLESLVGVYKRSEVTYTTKSPSQLNQKQKISTNRNFKLLASKSIKI